MADGVIVMIIKRRRFKQAMTLERRLVAAAEKLRSEAAQGGCKASILVEATIPEFQGPVP